MASRRGFLKALGALTLLGACKQPTPLRIATNVWPGYESLYVARANGTLPKGVQLIELLNASQVLAALRTRLVHAGALTLDEALRLWAARVPIRVVAVLDTSAGGDALVGRTFTSLAELRGKRIGVEESALGAYMLQRILEHAKLAHADITVVHLDISQHEASFRAGDVDGLVTFEPLRSRLLELGGRIVFDSRSLPDEIVDVLVVHAEALADDELRAQIVSVLRAIDGVVRTLAPHSPIYARMSRRLGLTPAQVESSFENLRVVTLTDNVAILGGTPSRLERQAKNLADRMTALELLPPIDVAGLFDPTLVHEALE